MAPDKEIPNDKLKNIGMTSFGLSDTESQIVLASYVKTSKEDDPVVKWHMDMVITEKYIMCM